MNRRRAAAQRDNRRLAAYLISFAAPIVIMLMVFVIKGVYPFGQDCFLRTDLYHQYAPFTKELRRKLISGEGLTWTWIVGCGTNFTSLFAYYLASPTNWLVILVPEGNVIEFVTYITVLKIGLCGLTFTHYLIRRENTFRFSACFFGIGYALSGYMAAYSWNIMWMDCIVLFPLVLLGLELLVREGKWALYGFTLGLSIFTNYYISMMTCGFLVFYFIFLLLTTEGLTARRAAAACGRFALFSLLAGGMAAVLLLPEVYALAGTASAKSTFPKTVTQYFSIIDMLARHMDLVATENGLDHWPNIFCGIAILELIPLYVMNKDVSWKEKAGYLALVLFLLASFSLNVLNYIWHGLHYPNSLPSRQSFTYVALMLTMGYRGLSGAGRRPARQVTIAFFAALTAVVVFQAICKDDAITWYVVWVSLVFVCLYGIVIYLARDPKSDKLLLAIATVLLLVIENLANTSVTSVTTVNRGTYMDIDKSVARFRDEVMDPDEEPFFRAEKVSQRSKNDGAWLSYPSASTFSSMSYAAMTSFCKEMGMEASTNAYSTRGATPFMYSLLGVRYLISPDDPGNALYELALTDDYTVNGKDKSVHLYKNSLSMPLGFVLPSYMSTWKPSKATPYAEQEDFVYQASGQAFPLFEILNSTSADKVATVHVPRTGNVYLYINGNVKEVSVNWSSRSKTFSNCNRGYLLDLGIVEASTTITVKSTNAEESVAVTAALFNDDQFRAARALMAQEKLEISSFSDTRITGTVTTGGGLLFLSIPYDEGWSIDVDGIAVTPAAFANTFLSLSLSAGTHTIDMYYAPRGLREGALVSVASVAAMLLALFLSWVIRKMKARPAPEPGAPDDGAVLPPAADGTLPPEPEAEGAEAPAPGEAGESEDDAAGAGEDDGSAQPQAEAEPEAPEDGAQSPETDAETPETDGSAPENPVADDETNRYNKESSGEDPES